MEFQHPATIKSNDRTRADRKRRRWRTTRQLVTFLSRRVLLFIFYSISLIEIINLPFHIDAKTPKYETAYACEGKTLTIECGKGSYINLIRANYGRFSITICNDHGNDKWSVNCMSYKSLRVLQSKCEQQQNCSVMASTSLFGDPCAGTHKYLEAHYQCVDASQLMTTSTQRPVIPPWLITSQPSVFITSTSRPSRFTPAITTLGGGQSGDSTVSSVLPPDVTPLLTNNFTGGNSAQVEVLTQPTTTTDLAMEPKTSLLFNNAKSVRGNNRNGIASGGAGGGGSGGEPSGSKGEQLFCGPTQARNLFWNLTRFNDLNVQPCPPGAVGLAKWRCQLQFPHLRMMLKHIDYSQDAQQMRLWSIWQSFWTDFDGGVAGVAEAAVKIVEAELDKRHWYPQAQPDLTGCHSLWLTSIEQRLKQQDLSLINLVNDLTQVTNNKKLYGGDLLLTMKIIKLIYTKISHSQEQIEDPKQREQVVYELLNGTLKIFSNLIDRRNFQMWQDLSATDRKYILTELLVHLEENSFLLAELIQRERHIVQKVQNILLSVRILNVRDMNQLQVFPDDKLDEQQWQLNEDRIEIPRPALLENSDNGLVRIVFVAFDRLERILRPAQSFIFQLKTLAINRQFGAAGEANEGDRFFQYTRNDSKSSGGVLDGSYEDKFQLLGGGAGVSGSAVSGGGGGDDDEAKWHQVYDEMRRSIEQKTADNVIILNSKIISASLGRGRHVELSHPVRIHFKHIQVENVTNPICVFWNFIDHAWSEDGCRVEMTNTSHTTCACDHLTNFALLMVQKQTPETQFFHAMNENNHLQTAAVTDEDGPEVDSPKAQTQELASLADFKKILLRNYERILSKNWDFLSQREVRELTGREQEQIFEAWKQQGLIDDASNVEKRRAIELIRSEFLRLKNFSRVRKMLVLIKNSLFWKMKRFNSHGSPLRETRQINWRELPKTPLVRDFLRNLIKFRDFLRDGKMDNEKVQNLDLVLTERQENAFIVRFMLLNEAYMRQFMNMTTAGGAGGADSLDHPSRVRSFRALNSFYIQEQLQFLQIMRQQKKEEKVFGSFPDSQLMDEFRKVEKDEWFSIEDIRADEITDHGLLGAGGSGGGLGGHPDGDGNGLEEGYIGSGDDNLFLYQLVRNNTTLRLFIYLSVVLCVVLIVVAIVLLKLYHGSMFKVANRSFITKNVYVCLVVFQILFLVGLEHDRRDIFCGINALLFHIVGLAIAAWLCFEGYQLYAVISKTEDFLHPHYMVPPTALDMNFTPSHLKRHGSSEFPVRMIYGLVTYGTILAIALCVCIFGGYNLVYVQETDNCMCMSRMVWRVPPIPQFVNGDEAFVGGNQSWIPLEPRILSSTDTGDQDMSAFTEKMPVANYYFYFTFLVPVGALFLATLGSITWSIFKIYKKYCQYQAFGQEEHDAQMLQAANGNGGLNTKTLDGKLRPNVYHLEKERMLMNGIRFYLRGSVIFLLIFSITWIFGYAFINRSPHTVLYGYLFALFNLLEGIFILLFVCVQHDKVQQEFEKWRRRKSLLNNQYAGQSPDDNGSPGADVTVRRRPLLDSLCCCLNVLFHPQPEKHVPMFDSGRHQVEIRTREDMMTYGMASGRGAGTMGRTVQGGAGFNGIPLADPRLFTPSHGRSQYYMSTLERNANGPHYYHDDGEVGDDERQQQPSVHMMNYMNDLDAAMTRPIAYPQYDGEEEPVAGYYPQPHLMGTMMMAANGGNAEVAEDPYNHMQNFEHVMHRKESHDRRVEDELWQGATAEQQFFVSQSQLAGPEFRRGGDTMQSMGGGGGTHGRTRRKKNNNNNNPGGHYQLGGSSAGSSYNVHSGDCLSGGGAEFVLEGRHRGDEPIYEEIMSNVAGGNGRQNPGSRHLSAFLNEKSNAVISCLEPIK